MLICRVNPVIFTTAYQSADLYLSISKFPILKPSCYIGYNAKFLPNLAQTYTPVSAVQEEYQMVLEIKA